MWALTWQASSTLLRTAHSWHCTTITPAARCWSKAAGAPAPPLGSCSACKRQPVTLMAHSTLGTCKCSHTLMSCYSSTACSKAVDAAHAPNQLVYATQQCACSHRAYCLQPQCRPHTAKWLPQGSAPAACALPHQSPPQPMTTHLPTPTAAPAGGRADAKQVTSSQGAAQTRAQEHSLAEFLFLPTLSTCCASALPCTVQLHFHVTFSNAEFTTRPPQRHPPHNETPQRDFATRPQRHCSRWSLGGKLQRHGSCSPAAVCVYPRHSPLFSLHSHCPVQLHMHLHLQPCTVHENAPRTTLDTLLAVVLGAVQLQQIALPAVFPGTVQLQLEAPCRLLGALLPPVQLQRHMTCGNAHVTHTLSPSNDHLAWCSRAAMSSACRVSAGVPTQSQGLQPLRPASWRSRPRLPASASRCLSPKTWRTYNTREV